MSTSAEHPRHGSRQTNHVPLKWGTGSAMSPAETVMWRAESDSLLRSTLIAVEVLDTAPDWDRLVAAHDWASRMVPRLRHRVVEPAFGFGTSRWSPDPDFDLHFHLRHSQLPSGGWPKLLEAAEQFAMAPFDRARPPWETLLLEGLPDGKAAFLLKLHHSITDGLGLVQLLEQLHSRVREHSPDKPQPVPDDIRETDAIGALAAQLSEDARALPSALGSAGATALRALRTPGKAVSEGKRYARSLRRVISSQKATPSPLLAQRSPNWRFGALDINFSSLRAAGNAAGGSLNDAFVAALLAGYRRYHQAKGRPVDTIPVAIPVSVRRADHPEGGNRIASARIAGPVGLADPSERIKAVNELIRRERAEPALESIGALSHALARLPGGAIAVLAGDITKGNDLQASCLPGMAENAYLAGAYVERTYPYAPLPGCPAMITLVTHGATCCVGINFDPAAISDGELFGQCVADGFAEVLRLVPDAPGPIRLG